MATISIASAAVSNWVLPSDVVLRIYALQSFLAADNTLVAAGVPSGDASQNDNFFQAVSCALNGTTLTVAACALESTTDAQDNPNAQYAACFFTNEGVRIGAFAQFAAFFLPASPNPTTWAAIALAQKGTP